MIGNFIKPDPVTRLKAKYRLRLLRERLRRAHEAGAGLSGVAINFRIQLQEAERARAGSIALMNRQIELIQIATRQANERWAESQANESAIYRELMETIEEVRANAQKGKKK